MKKKSKKSTKSDLPIGQLKEIRDFLPPPEKLVAPEELVKVTLSLDKKSLDFFKSRSAKLGTKYQKMIRELIRGYTAHYS